MKRVSIVIACAVVACGAPEEARVATPSAPAGTGSAPAAPAPLVADAIRKAICNAEPCGGDMSLIRVYRDASGAVKKLYRLYGRCSHNAGIYFDPDGKETETIPEQPIVPGSDEAREFEAKHAKQVGGMTATDAIRCSDGARVDP